MKNRLIFIAGVIILIVMCAAGQRFDVTDKEASIADVSFLIGSGGTSAAVKCQRDKGEEKYNLFLPSYAGEQTIRIRMGKGRQLKLGGDIYSDGQTIILPEEEESYEAVLYGGKGEELEKSILHVMRSKNLPAVFLSTASGNMEYIFSDKANKEAGYIQVITESGEMEDFEKLEHITGRGNTSWDADKKAFAIKFKDKAGFLGMDAAKSWALVANYYDGAYIRNMVGMEMARMGGIAVTPDSEFFDLYLNGEYAGLYQAMEKAEIGAGRVDAPNAYLLEIDYAERAALEEQYFLLPNKKPIVIHSPENLSEKRIKEIEAFFVELIRTLDAEDYVNPETGKSIFEYIDKESWAKTYIMEEILQNMDFGVTSHYMYLLSGKEGYKLYEGPLWDLDNTFGRGDKEREQLFANHCELETNNLGRWYARLYQKEEFYEEVVRQYQECFQAPLAWFAEQGVDVWEARIDAAVRMDMELWKGGRSVFMSDSSREEHIRYLKDYLVMKAGFLNQTWNLTEASRKQWEKDRVYTLPELRDEEWPAEPVTEEEEGIGLKTMILNGHGYIAAAAMIMALIAAVLVDRRKNGK